MRRTSKASCRHVRTGAWRCYTDPVRSKPCVLKCRTCRADRQSAIAMRACKTGSLMREDRRAGMPQVTVRNDLTCEATSTSKAHLPKWQSCPLAIVSRCLSLGEEVCHGGTQSLVREVARRCRLSRLNKAFVCCLSGVPKIRSTNIDPETVGL